MNADDDANALHVVGMILVVLVGPLLGQSRQDKCSNVNLCGLVRRSHRSSPLPRCDTDQVGPGCPSAPSTSSSVGNSQRLWISVAATAPWPMATMTWSRPRTTPPAA